MRTVAFFNNKGGVGKTTLACNIAHILATKNNKRILMIDLDPQCNTTQLILKEDLYASMYWPEESLEDSVTDHIFTAVNPMMAGEVLPHKVVPVDSNENRFKVDLIPGHPRLAMFEDLLGKWFSELLSGDLGAVRKTHWLKNLLQNYADDYDLALIDLGPSLGALNRSTLMASNNFLTPLGADIFSVIALRNIGEWIADWKKRYETGIKLCLENHPSLSTEFSISDSTLDIFSGYIGYTVQQYSTVTIRGERRATKAFEDIIRKVPEQVSAHLSSLADRRLDAEQLKLGDIPNLQSLVPLAQSVHSPLPSLTGKDGLTGGQFAQQRQYTEFIEEVARRLNANLERVE